MNDENIIIFTIGRMNPPTSGHLLLIKSMIEKALELNLNQINIILSHSKDFVKNPLRCSEKRSILLDENMIDNLKTNMMIAFPEKTNQIQSMVVKIICMDDNMKEEYGKHPIIKSINYILYDLYGYPRNNLKMLLFIGEDRLNEFNWLQQSLLKYALPISLEINGLPRPEGAMSATYIRKLATNGEFEEFKNQMKETGLSDENIKKLYLEIGNNIIEDEPVRKKTRKRGGKRIRTKRRRFTKRLYITKKRVIKKKYIK